MLTGNRTRTRRHERSAGMHIVALHESLRLLDGLLSLLSRISNLVLLLEALLLLELHLLHHQELLLLDHHLGL